MKERLNVDACSLDKTYKLLINQPWYKAYTMNVDNLFMVAYSKFSFNRRIVCISNLTHSQNSRINTPKDLIVMHINGMLNGYIESFNGKMRYEFLDGEMFYSLKPARFLIESWRREYNRIRPHSS